MCNYEMVTIKIKLQNPIYTTNQFYDVKVFSKFIHWMRPGSEWVRELVVPKVVFKGKPLVFPSLGHKIQKILAFSSIRSSLRFSWQFAAKNALLNRIIASEPQNCRPHSTSYLCWLNGVWIILSNIFTGAVFRYRYDVNCSPTFGIDFSNSN